MSGRAYSSMIFASPRGPPSSFEELVNGAMESQTRFKGEHEYEKA